MTYLELLTSDIIRYVDPVYGIDDASHGVGVGSAAWKTTHFGARYLALNYALGGCQATLQLAPGDYRSEGFVIPPPYVGRSANIAKTANNFPLILGDPAHPENYQFDTIFGNVSPVGWHIRGVEVRKIYLDDCAWMTISKLRFSASDEPQIVSFFNSALLIGQDGYKVAGSAPSHVEARQLSTIIYQGGAPVTFEGSSVTWSQGFAQVSLNAVYEASGAVWGGTATGSGGQGSASSGGCIVVNGEYLPGGFPVIDTSGGGYVIHV